MFSVKWFLKRGVVKERKQKGKLPEERKTEIDKSPFYSTVMKHPRQLAYKEKMFLLSLIASLGGSKPDWKNSLFWASDGHIRGDGKELSTCKSHNCSVNVHFYIRRLSSSQSVPREVSFCNRKQWIQKSTVGQCAGNKNIALQLKWDIYISFPLLPSLPPPFLPPSLFSCPQGSSVCAEEGPDRLEESEVVDDRCKTVFSGHNRAPEHMDSQCLRLPVQ